MAYIKKMVWLIVGSGILKGAAAQSPPAPQQELSPALQAIQDRYSNARKMLEAYDADLRAVIIDYNPEARDLRVPASAEVVRRFTTNHPDFGGIASPQTWELVQARWVQASLLAMYLESHEPIIQDICRQLAGADSNGPDVLMGKTDFDKESSSSWGLVQAAFENTMELLEYCVEEAKTLIQRTAYPWFQRMFVPITTPLKPTVRKLADGSTSNLPPPVAQLSYVQNNRAIDVIANMRTYLKGRVAALEDVMAQMTKPLPVPPPPTPAPAPTPEPMVQQKPVTENPEDEYLEMPEPPVPADAVQEVEELVDPRVDAGIDPQWIDGMRKRLAVIKEFANG